MAMARVIFGRRENSRGAEKREIRERKRDREVRTLGYREGK